MKKEKNMTSNYNIPTLPLPYDLEAVAILKQLGKANRLFVLHQ